MLRPFDPSKVQFKRVLIKQVTFANNGTLSVIDESITNKEKLIRYDIGTALYTMWKKVHKITKYFVPTPGIIMLYNDIVIAVEKAPYGSDDTWEASMISTFNAIMDKIDSSGKDWYFDGQYIYSLVDGNITNAFISGNALTDDNAFKSIKVNSYALNFIGFNSSVFLEQRHCIGLRINDTITITPPIWLYLSSFNRRDLDTPLNNLSAVNDRMSVHLQFALSAGTQLSKAFGYKSIDALNLPQMMIQLSTINLTKLPREFKNTTDIGMPFLHCLAWLLGIGHKVNTLDELLIIKGLIKYLTSTGIFVKKELTQYDGIEQEIPLLSVDEILNPQGLVTYKVA
jgi:hypothetical protein